MLVDCGAMITVWKVLYNDVSAFQRGHAEETPEESLHCVEEADERADLVNLISSVGIHLHHTIVVLQQYSGSKTYFINLTISVATSHLKWKTIIGNADVSRYDLRAVIRTGKEGKITMLAYKSDDFVLYTANGRLILASSYQPSTQIYGWEKLPGGVTPDFRTWESCRTRPLVGGFSRGSPVSPTLSFRCCSILISITPTGSQDHDSSAEMQERRKRDIPEETHQRVASSGTITTCHNPGAKSVCRGQSTGFSRQESVGSSQSAVVSLQESVGRSHSAGSVGMSRLGGVG
ncbi:hypothetical protein PR048_021698 [Dryococelus australis]|uniref:Uncharacterized protein n=1 Tax=Dryococelus australis TaxID=614101 RepID=A0ABQ9GZ06_9NEOP|nr:hypothetical protein PR048_021698 [Dryococelus australis]